MKIDCTGQVCAARTDRQTDIAIVTPWAPCRSQKNKQTNILYQSSIFDILQEETWCGAKDECSQVGLLLPIFDDFIWHPWVRIALYLVGLLYSFVAVFIVADIFMCSIDAITSTTKKITVSGPDGQQEVMEVPVWNGTIANIVLMSLGPR